jgi:chromosome segregation ATPase
VSYTLLFLSQGFLKSTLLYYYFRKVSATDNGAEDLKKRLTEVEEENAQLKVVVAKNEEDLRVLGEHSAMMECKVSDASKAKDQAEAGLSKLSEEFKGLQVKHSSLQESHATLQTEHAELQKDHSILKEELGQLEEKHTETLEQLKESQVSPDRALKGKLVAKERYKHFYDEHMKVMLKLKEARSKAANYLHQLSFASRV